MISWKLSYYSDLSRDVLYQILKIRQEVFIIEQDCNYLDADNLDKDSQHVLCYNHDELIAYSYLTKFDKKSKKHNCILGIVISDKWQGKGFGKKICKYIFFVKLI